LYRVSVPSTQFYNFYSALYALLWCLTPF